MVITGEKCARCQRCDVLLDSAHNCHFRKTWASILIFCAVLLIGDNDTNIDDKYEGLKTVQSLPLLWNGVTCFCYRTARIHSGCSVFTFRLGNNETLMASVLRFSGRHQKLLEQLSHVYMCCKSCVCTK